jgi:hypothetical protein
LARPNQGLIRAGLERVTAKRPAHPPFIVLSKPGWWPPDRANADLAYVHDVAAEVDYLVAVYYPGSLEEAEVGIGWAVESLFAALHEGRLCLSRQP